MFHYVCWWVYTVSNLHRIDCSNWKSVAQCTIIWALPALPSKYYHSASCIGGQDLKAGVWSRVRVVYLGMSSLNARETRAFWWPLYSRFTSPLSTFHRRATLSDDAANPTKHEYIMKVLASTVDNKATALNVGSVKNSYLITRNWCVDGWTDVQRLDGWQEREQQETACLREMWECTDENRLTEMREWEKPAYLRWCTASLRWRHSPTPIAACLSKDSPPGWSLMCARSSLSHLQSTLPVTCSSKTL